MVRYIYTSNNGLRRNDVAKGRGSGQKCKKKYLDILKFTKVCIKKGRGTRGRGSKRKVTKIDNNTHWEACQYTKM